MFVHPKSLSYIDQNWFPMCRSICNASTGADLHVHDGYMVNNQWLIQNVTYRHDCYMCIQSNGDPLFRIANSKPTDSGT